MKKSLIEIATQSAAGALAFWLCTRLPVLGSLVAVLVAMSVVHLTINGKWGSK